MNGQIPVCLLPKQQTQTFVPSSESPSARTLHIGFKQTQSGENSPEIWVIWRKEHYLPGPQLPHVQNWVHGVTFFVSLGCGEKPKPLKYEYLFLLLSMGLPRATLLAPTVLLLLSLPFPSLFLGFWNSSMSLNNPPLASGA